MQRRSKREPVDFEDVFIMFDAFHIKGSLFSAIGKLIQGSWGPYLLIESGFIDLGSMNRFCKGKRYYRCRRSHTILLTALHRLHFQSFLMVTHTDIYFTDGLKVWFETKQITCHYHQWNYQIDTKSMSMAPLQEIETKQHNFGWLTAELLIISY